MITPHRLTIEEAKAALDIYLKDDKPTLSGFTKLLKIKSYCTFLKHLNIDDDIGDILAEGYKHYLSTHEKRLHGASCQGSMFALKSSRQLGFVFHENDTSNIPLDTSIIITVIKDEPTTK